MRSRKDPEGTAWSDGRRAQRAGNLPVALASTGKANSMRDRVARWKNDRQDHLNTRDEPRNAPYRSGPVLDPEILRVARWEARLPATPNDWDSEISTLDSSDDESNLVRKGVEQWRSQRRTRLRFRQKPILSPVRSGPTPKNEKSKLKFPTIQWKFPLGRHHAPQDHTASSTSRVGTVRHPVVHEGVEEQT